MAGMAWAPEAVYDTDRGEFLVFRSSALYDAEDGDPRGAAYSQVLAAWTPDFRELGAPRVLIDRGAGHRLQGYVGFRTTDLTGG